MFFESLFECPMTHWIIFEYLQKEMHRCGMAEVRASKSEGRDVTMLKHQEASVRNHGAVVNTVTVIGRVGRAAALLCHD